MSERIKEDKIGSEETKETTEETKVETTISEEELFQSIGRRIHSVNGLQEKIKTFVVEEAKKSDMSLSDVRTMYTNLRDEVNDLIISESVKWQKKNK